MCCCNAVELRKHFVHIVQGYVMTSEIGGNKSFSRVVVDWLRCKNGRGARYLNAKCLRCCASASTSAYILVVPQGRLNNVSTAANDSFSIVS